MTDHGGWRRVLSWRYDLHHQPYPRHEIHPGWERLSVRHKVNVWNTAAEKGGVPRQFASYLDLLDLPTAQSIQNLATMTYARERRAAWDRIHEELKLLPRCPEHDTVRFYSTQGEKRGVCAMYVFLLFQFLYVVSSRYVWTTFRCFHPSGCQVTKALCTDCLRPVYFDGTLDDLVRVVYCSQLQQRVTPHHGHRRRPCRARVT